MTKEEYIKRMKEDNEWAPGWEAIDAEFDRLYVYDMGNGCRHIVTYGMTELYADEKAFGGEFSRWGYEMTLKLKADSAEECMWALDMLSNLARYTYTSERWFEPFECIHGGTPLHAGTDSKITSLITVADTSAQSLDTLNGKVDFIQLVGITEEEYQAIQQDLENIHKLIELMKQDNPDLATDMNRTKSYL